MTTPAGRPLLEIDGLTACFDGPHGRVDAVADVSMSLRAGGRLGVVGESGSGKTQTFFGLLGLMRGRPGVVAGRARLGDVELLPDLARFVDVHPRDGRIRKDPAWQRHQERALRRVLGKDVALLFQDSRRSLIPYWTIGRHLEDVLRRRGDTRPAATSLELLGRLGFAEPARIRDAFPEALSGGEAQRALLAVTLAMEPSLLVADEPTTGLDTLNQARVLEAVSGVVASSGCALVLISHDLAVIDAMVDNIVVMYAGRVMERVAVRTLREQHDERLHPYTRMLRESQRRRAIGAPLPPPTARPVLGRSSTGCPLQPRCPLRPTLAAETQRRCAEAMPPETPLGPDQSAACWGLAAAGGHHVAA